MTSSHTPFAPVRKVWLGFAIVALALASFAPVHAADNTATGDIAGGAGTLNNSNTFTINSTTLALVKAAFLADGTPLASGVSVPKGSLVKFVIYIDNATTVPADSVNISDPLNALFAYQPGTLKIDLSQNSGATAAAIFAAVNASAPVSDAVSGVDVAGVTGSTVSAGLSAGNSNVTIPANKVFAVEFSVKVQ